MYIYLLNVVICRNMAFLTVTPFYAAQCYVENPEIDKNTVDHTHARTHILTHALTDTHTHTRIGWSLCSTIVR